MLRPVFLRLTAPPLAAVMLLGACYRYVPATGGELVLGAAYRAHLSPEGTRSVTPLLGPNVGAFDGVILSASDSALEVAMSSTTKRLDPNRILWSGEQVMVPRDAVASFDRREIDRGRTTRAVILSALGLFAIGKLWSTFQGRVSGGAKGPPITPF